MTVRAESKDDDTQPPAKAKLTAKAQSMTNANFSRVNPAIWLGRAFHACGAQRANGSVSETVSTGQA